MYYILIYGVCLLLNRNIIFINLFQNCIYPPTFQENVYYNVCAAITLFDRIYAFYNAIKTRLPWNFIDNGENLYIKSGWLGTKNASV
jgi:hypothetical protein